MPSNSITFYTGNLSLDAEAIIKSRLKRISPHRSAAGAMLVPLLLEVSPEAWALLIEDAYPDEEDLAVFLIRLVSSSPGIIAALRTALTTVEEHRESEATSRRAAILEAASSLSDLIPNQSTITEDSLDSPSYSPGAIESRLKNRLGGE
jgi:hypothetical protein